MARITVEDCIDKVPNRFDLVLLAAHRARALSKGAVITVEQDNDKPPVIALREIAEPTLPAGDLREGLLHSMQKQVDIDEPEAAAAPMLAADARPRLGRACERCHHLRQHRLRKTIEKKMSDDQIKGRGGRLPLRHSGVNEFDPLTIAAGSGQRSSRTVQHGSTGVHANNPRPRQFAAISNLVQPREPAAL